MNLIKTALENPSGVAVGVAWQQFVCCRRFDQLRPGLFLLQGIQVAGLVP